MSEREILGEGDWLRLCRKGPWEFVQRHGARGVVAIYAVTDDDELVLVEQHRASLGGSVVEIPAGLVGDEPGTENESLEATARRELLEETGFEAGWLERVAEGPTAAGLTDEVIALFVARDLRRVAPGGGTDSEAITVRLVPRSELRGWLEERRARGLQVDIKIYGSAFFLGDGS